MCSSDLDVTSVMFTGWTDNDYNMSAQFDSGKLVESLELEGADLPDDERAVEQSDNSLVRLVNTMVVEAYTQGVSDIHIESYPGREATRIRLRRDGVMHDYLKVPPSYRSAIVSRIKIMASMDISERRKPQDGKLEFTLPGKRKIELRVATIPTSNQLEDVVLRVLSGSRPLKLDDLGFENVMLDRKSTRLNSSH